MLHFASHWLKKSMTVMTLAIMVVSTSSQAVSAFTLTPGSGGVTTVTNANSPSPSIVAAIYNPPSSNLSNAKATPQTFKPNNGEQTTIHFDLAAPSTVWLDIMQNGATINRLYFNAGKHMLGGGYDTSWNGLDGSATLVPDGTYQFLVTAKEDGTGQTFTAQDNIYVTSVAAVQPVVITPSAASPNPFNPTNGQTTNVNYSINAQANLNIDVLDGSTSIVQLSSSPLTLNAGSYSVSWNGKLANGTVVSPKTYYIRFSGSNIATPTPYVTTVPVTVTSGSTTASANVTYVYAENASFNPNTSTNRIHYAVDNSSTAVVKILDNNNNPVRTFGASSVNSGFDYFTNWDGRNDSNALVAAGNYSALVQLSNSGVQGNSKQSAQFAVNFGGTTNNAPVVTFVGVNPSSFNPTSSQTTLISYNLDKPATSAMVQILDGSNIVRRTISNTGTSSTSTNTLTWDGRDDSNNILPVATYTVKVSATNSFGTGTNSASVSITNGGTTNSAPVVSSLLVNPSSFNPSSSQTTLISYNLDKPATTANVQIIDSSNNVRRNIYNTGTSSTSTNTLTWDGRDDSNNILPVASYTVKVSATNSFGTGTNTASVSITNNTVGNCSSSNGTPTLSNVYASPATFNPNNQTTTVSFSVDRAATITVQVLGTNSSSLIRTLADNICQTNGTSGSYNWDGRDVNGNIAPDGGYTVRVIANNGTGSTTQYTYVNVNSNGSNNCNNNSSNCNNNGSIIQNLYVNPEIFNPANGETSTVYYNLNQTATVTTQVLDQNSIVIRTLVDHISRYSNNYAYTTQYGSYNYADLWNGRDVNSNIVPDGNYQFRVTAMGTNGLNDTRTAYVQVSTNGNIIGFPSGSTCGGYIDVTSNSQYCKAIEYLKGLGVFTGYSDGTFRPDQPINRAETVKVILLALSIPISNNFTTLFNDTNSSSWYATYLSTAKMLGIIRGYPDGTFRPDQTVNRVELLKVFLESSGVNIPYCNYAPYSDTPVNADTRWYVDYVCYAKTNGLMHDDGAGRFSPAAPMTRGDVADLFYQFDNSGLYNKANNPYYNGNNNNCTYGTTNCNNNCTYNTTNCNNNCAYNTVNCNSNCTYGTVNCNNNCAYSTTNCNNNCAYNTTNCNNNCTYNTYNSNCGNCIINSYNCNNNNSTGYPVVSSVSVSPSSFNPNSGQSTTIYYSLSQTVNSVQVEIMDSNNTIRRNIYNAGTLNGANSSVIWNGRDDNSNILPTGTYTVKVLATNSYGLGQGQATVYVNSSTGSSYGNPVVNSVVSNPSTFSPASGQSTTIYYSLGQSATNAQVQIMDYNNTVRRTFYNTGTSSGNNSVSWNGRDDFNNIIPGGTYTIRVTATNSYGTGSNTGSVILY